MRRDLLATPAVKRPDGVGEVQNIHPVHRRNLRKVPRHTTGCCAGRGRLDLILSDNNSGPTWQLLLADKLKIDLPAP